MGTETQGRRKDTSACASERRRPTKLKRCLPADECGVSQTVKMGRRKLEAPRQSEGCQDPKQRRCHSPQCSPRAKRLQRARLHQDLEARRVHELDFGEVQDDRLFGTEVGFNDVSEPSRGRNIDLAAQDVHLIASLPCYTAANVDRQRGLGVFDGSIAALKQLKP